MKPEGRPGTPLDIPAETIEDLYDGAPCGYLTTDLDGVVVRVNRTFLDWTGHTHSELEGRVRFAELLTSGGRIYYETHLAPLLLMQGSVTDIALDVVCADGRSRPVLVSAEVRQGEPSVIRATLLDATIRHDYERELLYARRRAEASEERVSSVALALQRSMLQGGLERGAGFTVETRYRPAVHTLEVGGDWYDSFLVPERGTLAVSVGDVVGRGLVAACAMGQLRAAVRALTVGSRPGPSRLLDQLDAFAERVPDAWLATVAAAELDVATRQVRFACAGHVPPVVVPPNRPAKVLWDGRSTPLGIRVTQPRSEALVVLEPGSHFLLFTDGLIERRGRDLDEGLSQLVDAATRLGDRPPEIMIDALLDELVGSDDERSDDVCLLCVTMTDRSVLPSKESDGYR